MSKKTLYISNLVRRYIDEKLALEKSIGNKSASHVLKPRFQYLSRKIHESGPRVFAEALAEIAERTDPETVLSVMERFGELSPDLVKKLGGDQFPPRLIEEVPKE